MKILRRISNNRRLILRLSPVLEKIASFVKSENLELAHAARTLLIEAETPTYTEIKIRVYIVLLLIFLSNLGFGFLIHKCWG